MQQLRAPHAGLTPTVAGATTAAALQLNPTAPAAGVGAAAASLLLSYAANHVAYSAVVFFEM
jgi:hypothetical protein